MISDPRSPHISQTILLISYADHYFIDQVEI